MRLSTPIQTIIAASVIALLAGCSGGTALAPRPSVLQSHTLKFAGRIPVALSPLAMLKLRLAPPRHYASFDACPVTGTIEYISDFSNNVINIYKGRFAGQAPCGQISSSGMVNPQGMFVKASTHDLYVANTGGHDIFVFHRGARRPFKSYTDPRRSEPGRRHRCQRWHRHRRQHLSGELPRGRLDLHMAQGRILYRKLSDAEQLLRPVPDRAKRRHALLQRCGSDVGLRTVMDGQLPERIMRRVHLYWGHHEFSRRPAIG